MFAGHSACVFKVRQLYINYKKKCLHEYLEIIKMCSRVAEEKFRLKLDTWIS